MMSGLDDVWYGAFVFDSDYFIVAKCASSEKITKAISTWQLEPTDNGSDAT
jgi:hypothetical protein